MTIFDLYRPFMKRFRGRRMAMFRDMIQPTEGQVILDVGGYAAFWNTSGLKNLRILCLNVHPVEMPPPGDLQIETVTGDGCTLPYPDASFDIVFSNSVIEHVGDWNRQLAFAQEARRVGKQLWIQTPAYEFPIEPHYVAPCIQYLPKWLQRRILRWCTPWGLLQKPTRAEIDEAINTTRLLSKREMRCLFPDCEIIGEPFCGLFSKSWIAVRR
jgi:SAM-dependent methyltransferase